MENSRKKIKGSAVATDDGMFIFTPYGTREESEKSLLLVKSTAHATLWKSKNSYVIRFKINKRSPPSVTTLATELLQHYDKISKDMKNKK